MTSAKNVNCMDIHKPFDDFAKVYGFKDTEEVYTNGIELIPVFRVKQWLEQEPCDTYTEGYFKGYDDGLEQKLEEPCGDTISREHAIQTLHAQSDEFPEFHEAIYLLENEPSVTPKEKTGHWIRWYEQKGK